MHGVETFGPGHGNNTSLGTVPTARWFLARRELNEALATGLAPSGPAHGTRVRAEQGRAQPL